MGRRMPKRLLATQACTTLSPDTLRQATLYSFGEPCAMCAGAILTGGNRPAGLWPQRTSLAHRHRQSSGKSHARSTLPRGIKRGQRPTEVIGPDAEDEAEAVHAGAWK